MTLKTIRSLLKRKITTAFAGLSPALPIMYYNVQEEPPGGVDIEYIRLIISLHSLTEPVVAKAESSIEVIRGSLQISCYGPTAKGMKTLKELATTAAPTLDTLY